MSDLLLPEDVAAAMRCHRDTVIKRARAGQWPHLRVGNRYLFTAAHLEQIKALCEVPVTPLTSPDAWGRRTRGRRTA